MILQVSKGQQKNINDLHLLNGHRLLGHITVTNDQSLHVNNNVGFLNMLNISKSQNIWQAHQYIGTFQVASQRIKIAIQNMYFYTVKKNRRCDTYLHFFSEKGINRLNSLSPKDIDSPNINSFKNCNEKRRARQMEFFKDTQSTSPIRLQNWIQDKKCMLEWMWVVLVFARCSRTR